MSAGAATSECSFFSSFTVPVSPGVGVDEADAAVEAGVVACEGTNAAAASTETRYQFSHELIESKEARSTKLQSLNSKE